MNVQEFEASLDEVEIVKIGDEEYTLVEPPNSKAERIATYMAGIHEVQEDLPEVTERIVIAIRDALVLCLRIKGEPVSADYVDKLMNKTRRVCGSFQNPLTMACVRKCNLSIWQDEPEADVDEVFS